MAKEPGKLIVDEAGSKGAPLASEALPSATTVHEFGVFLLAQRRIGEAEAVLQDALTLRSRTRGDDHRDIVETLRVLSAIRNQRATTTRESESP